MTDKKYNNITDVSTNNLYKMLNDVRYQDSDSQSMIKAEISFRTNETFINQMFTNAININAIDNLSNDQLNKVADILGVK